MRIQNVFFLFMRGKTLGVMCCNYGGLLINQKVSLPGSCSVTVLITGRKKVKAKKIIRAAPFESAFITPAFDR